MATEPIDISESGTEKSGTEKKVTSSKSAPRKPATRKKATTAKETTAKAAPKKSTAKKSSPKKTSVAAAAEKTITKKASTSPNTEPATSPGETAKDNKTAEKEHETVFPGLSKNRDWKGFALRVLYIAAFSILGWIAFGAAITLTIIQVVLTILLGAPNETLKHWVNVIGKYLSEVFSYISWKTDEKPFPLDRPVPRDDK